MDGGVIPRMDGGRPRGDYEGSLPLDVRILNIANYYSSNKVALHGWTESHLNDLSALIETSKGDIGELVINDFGVLNPESLKQYLQSLVNPEP